MTICLILDYYSRNISSDRDTYRTDAFLDFLRTQNVTNASELVGLPKEFDKLQLVDFLRNVCVPDILDQSLALESTRSVEDERAKVLVQANELITSVTGSTAPELLEELTEIRTRQIVREAAQRLDQSKVYVNIEELKSLLAHRCGKIGNDIKLLLLKRTKRIR